MFVFPRLPQHRTIFAALMLNAPLSYWIFRLRSALRWYWRAGTRHDVRSPLLANFIREVYADDRHYHAFDLIRSVRRYWRVKKGRVGLQPLGAPSKTTAGMERSVRSLVATNAIDDDCGRLLFRLALHLRARRIIEFGTNAGISTLYLHAADTRAQLDTVEGNPAVAALAAETFKVAGAGSGLRAHTGLFNDWLFRHKEASDKPLDLFFLDGDHRYEPTLRYVKELLPQRSEQAVFVIADIHWSDGMERAWEELKTLPEVTASVDVYHFGLLFFGPGGECEHVGLVGVGGKPWRV